MEVYCITWHSYNNQKTHIVGYLVHDDYWHFQYHDGVKDAIKEGFKPFPDLPYNGYAYRSTNLFSVFSIRYKDVNLMKDSNGELLTDKVLIIHRKQKEKA